MAQGCILPFSAEDVRQLRHSLHNPLALRALWSAKRALEQQGAVAYSKNVTYPLIDPDHPAHQAFVETVLRNVAGNESILDTYKRALPLALTILAQQTPDVLGLVAASHGKGASALTRTLAHRTRGDAFAYELLGTAELIQRNRNDDRGSEATNGGPELRIFDADRIDLGVRLPAHHRSETGGIEGLFAPAGTGLSKYRETFEADAFIYRGDHAVGIDFKHARTGNSFAGDMDHFPSQLEAIANGLMTEKLGLREFHFVTNGYFSEPFVAAVARINDQVCRETGDAPPIGLHEHVNFPLG